MNIILGLVKDVKIYSKIYNYIMGVREDLKILLVKEKMTLTELAKEAEIQSGKKFTVHTLSQKLVNSSMKYDELKFLANILGYRIVFEKIEKE